MPIDAASFGVGNVISTGLFVVLDEYSNTSSRCDRVVWWNKGRCAGAKATTVCCNDKANSTISLGDDSIVVLLFE
jgi:hypothetical protein